MLLSSYLIPYLYENGYDPRIEKKGNKIMQIRTKNKICFRDVTKLLAPSTNLRKFGELFDLHQAKAHFPFKILSSIEVLSRTALPTDKESWISDLTGNHMMSDDEFSKMLAEAQTLFNQASCQNLGDYLRSYLILDVEILFEATQKWRKELKRVIGLDFIETRKFTISSLSYTAGLKTMELNGRIGSFFPNNVQQYSLLRKGMRGYVFFKHKHIYQIVSHFITNTFFQRINCCISQ